MKKILFIYNPRAGRGLIKNHLFEIIQTASEDGCIVTVFPTQAKGDATEIVQKLDLNEYERVLCCGGDGTLGEVMNGLMKSGCEKLIGYIPAGSTNDFAASLGLPKDVHEAAEVAITGDVRKCDVGKFNDNYFMYVAAFGMFTDVSYSTDQGLKNALGHLAYILKGATEIAKIKAYHMRFEYDGGVEEGDYLLGLISSTTSIGGVLNLSALDVALDDGFFEVILFRAPEQSRDLAEFTKELADTFSTAVSTGETMLRVNIEKNIVKFKASFLNITSYDNAAWTLDGEFGGDARDIQIKNLQQKMLISTC